MTTPPLLAPPEAQPDAALETTAPSKTPQSPKTTSPKPTKPADGRISEELSRPFRLGIIGLGAAIGLGFRLAIANGYSAINFRPLILAAALSSAVIGVGLLAMAAERDRLGAPLAWISGITALAWGVLNWISPPFASSVTVWSRPDQVVLSILGVGNGLLLAGLVALAFVRRRPTLTVAATMLSAVAALASNSVLLRYEWPAIVAIGAAFALVLLAWDRSPRREHIYVAPEESPRISRAALSFISVALCGTAIQLWISRMSIPRSVPAIGISLLLVAAAFASMVRVRREIEQRDTTLSEWTSWMREIRTSDFRAEMETYESPVSDATFDPRPPIGLDGEAPRALSFPNLTAADAGVVQEAGIAPEDDHEAVEAALGAFGPADLAAAAADLPGDESSSHTLDLVPDSAPSQPIPADSDDASEAAALDALWSRDIGPAPSGAVVTGLPTPDRLDRVVTTPASPDLSPVDATTLPRIQIPTIDAEPEPIVRAPAHPSAEPEPVALAPGPATTPAPTGGAFSAMLGAGEPAVSTDLVQVADLDALHAWLTSPVATARIQPLLVAIEAMSLDEFESLPADDALMATAEIGSFLADIMPTADLVSWIDGPYFVVAHASKKNSEMLDLNRQVRSCLKATNGALAFLRPGPETVLDEIVNEAVTALLQARRLERRAQGR